MTTTGGVMTLNGIECRYMTPESLMQTRPLKYVDCFGLLEFLRRLNRDYATSTHSPTNVLLRGPTGGGKSLALAFLAQQEAMPYLSLDCTEESRDRDLRGGFVARGGETSWVFGTVANAILVANLTGRAMLVIEEINGLSPQRQKALNALLDFRNKLEVPELSTRLELAPGAKLFVAATMNPVSYGGTYELNDDLKSRFVEIEVPYPPPAAEKEILRSMVDVEPPQEALDHLVNIARETRQGALSYELSTRDLVELVRLFPKLHWDDITFLVAQKFNDEDRRLIIDRIADITKRGVFTTLSQRAGLTK